MIRWWHLCGALIVAVAGASAGGAEVDREVEIRRCAGGAELCIEIRERSREAPDKPPVFAVTEILADQSGHPLYVSQRVLAVLPSESAGRAEQPRAQLASLRQDNVQPVMELTWVTHHGPASAYPGVVTGGGGALLVSGGTWAESMRRETLRAAEQNRAFVDTQQRRVERSADLTREWASAVVGNSAASMHMLLGRVAAARLSGNVDALIHLEDAFGSRVPPFVSPPQIRLEGAAVTRRLESLDSALSRYRYRDALGDVRALRSLAASDEGVRKRLAALTRGDGTFDLSRVVADLPPSPVINISGSGASNYPLEGVAWLADEYELLWAETDGLSFLSTPDRLGYLLGLSTLRQAASAGSSGDWATNGWSLRASNSFLEGVRGFTDGLIAGLRDTALMVPEMARVMATFYVDWRLRTPKEKIEKLLEIGAALIRIPEYVKLSVITTYTKFVNGTAYERSELIGRATFDILVALATGEAAPFLKAAGNVVELGKLSQARKAVAASIASLRKGGEYERVFMSAAESVVHVDVPEAAISRLATLIQAQPETAAGLLNLRTQLAAAAMPEADALWVAIVNGWGVRDARTAEALSLLAGAGSRGLASPTANALLARADRYRTFVDRLATLPKKAQDTAVIRAIPFLTKEGRVLTEKSAFEMYPEMVAGVGRYKGRGEVAWSTAVVRGDKAKVSAFETAIEEFGQYQDPDKAFLLVERRISTNNALVLDNATLSTLGLSGADVTKRNIITGAYEDTLLLGRAAREAGFDALVAPSAAVPDEWVLHILHGRVLGH